MDWTKKVFDGDGIQRRGVDALPDVRSCQGPFRNEDSIVSSDLRQARCQVDMIPDNCVLGSGSGSDVAYGHVTSADPYPDV